MRKILVAVGSGMKNGNTDQLADAFIKGAEEKDMKYKNFFWEILTFTDVVAVVRVRKMVINVW